MSTEEFTAMGFPASSIPDGTICETVAFEPDGPEDFIGAPDLEGMRATGSSEAVIELYKRYRDEYYMETLKGWVPRPPRQAKVPTP
jgi:hypothetical protein